MSDRKRKRLLIGAVGLFLALAGMPVATYADVPGAINYQGYLTNNGGPPVDGTVTLTFSIYDTNTGGTAQWTESHTGVSVIDGIFSVVLGETTPITASCLASGSCHLGVSLGSDPEMSPRQKLTGSVFSIRAKMAENLDCSGCVSQDKLDFIPGDGDITAVNPGTGLTGGGESGNVTLNVNSTSYYEVTAFQTSDEVTKTTSQHHFCVMTKIQFEYFGPGEIWCKVEPNGNGTWTLKAKSRYFSDPVTCGCYCF